ncbi:MAG: hypothetical protein MRY63_04235 [Neomegalonema sp.]|nr:hypothetical protein [Neomegalonema sp.]
MPSSKSVIRELYLDPIGNDHRFSKDTTPKATGFVQSFNGTVVDGFARMKMRETFHETIEARKADLDVWLIQHQPERPHADCRNQGVQPSEIVISHVSQEGVGRNHGGPAL